MHYLKEVEEEHKDELRAMPGLWWLECSKLPGLQKGEEKSVPGHIPLEAILGEANMEQHPLMPDRFLYDKYVSD